MLRGVRIRISRDELLGVCEAEPEQKMGGSFKILANADSHVLDVEARKGEVGGRGDCRTASGRGEEIARVDPR